MHLISVVVPIYKAENYITRCVDSILNQTYRNLEVILVDDGSPDLCPSICDEYARKDSRVRVLHKKNGGVSTARNAGLDMAQGDYIAFVDSDDYLEPNMYEKMMGIVSLYECEIVMCDCIKEYENSSEIYTHNIRAGYYSREQLKEEYYPHLLMMENVEYPATISNWVLLWKSTLNTAEMRYEPGIRYSEDLLFGAKLLYCAKSFYYMKGAAYYHYVMNMSSVSHTYVPDKWNDYIRLHEKITNTFKYDKQFDFSYQIDLCLLFFVFNTIGEIYGTDLLIDDKKAKIKKILKDPKVIEMFKNIKVKNLQISRKQKLITMAYKYKIGVSFLVKYYGKKQSVF